MATVFRKTYTKPLPEGVELFTRKGQRFARWKDAEGKARTAKVTTGKDGSPRLLVEAGTFTAKYRDGSGVVREVTTGCRQEQAARQVLADLVRRAEQVKGGILSAAEDAMIDHQGTSLSGHFDAFIDHMAGKGTTAGHRKTTRAYLDRLASDCDFSKLVDLHRGAVEGWLAARAAEGMSARSRNAYRCAIVSFCNWCLATRRVVANPLAGVPKVNEKADPRRRRRSLTEAELVKLLEVARRRPLLDAMTIRRGKRKGEAAAGLRPETIARLERLGWERALIYKTLVLTGLRRGELASLTVGQLELDGPAPFARLEAADEKNRQGSEIRLRADLVADLRNWLAEKLTAARDQARKRGEPMLVRLPEDTRLFTVPVQLVRILDRDLVMAGIARRVRDPETGKTRIDKRDGRGWTVDVHALRHAFGTLLSKAGVPLRTAQAAMRHSDPSLTANVYTDPRLLDIAGAVEALPSLPLDGERVERQKATGTADERPLAPTLAPNLVQASPARPIAGKRMVREGQRPRKARGPQAQQNKGIVQPHSTADKSKQTGRDRARTYDLFLVREAL